MREKSLKIRFLLLFIILFMVLVSAPTFCIWGTIGDGKFYWLEADGTLAFDGWKIIDDDNDGIGYYYYFVNGFIMLDDITPDYKVIGIDGKRLDMDGMPEKVEIRAINSYDYGDLEIFSAEILEQIKADSDDANVVKGITSSGVQLLKKDYDSDSELSPDDFITIEDNADGTAKTLLGKNVVLKEEKDRRGYDTQMKKSMTEYIKSGDKYSKKVNGTIFNKTKWKEVMALKGTGASIVFENPSNNFNKLKGRIATHYFTYSDRTTQCVLYIYDDETNEEIYTNAEFNYNAGATIETVFPRKTNKLRFELEVSGQYTSRICYLRNFEYGFDRSAYEDELYEDEIEEEYNRRMGTDSEMSEEELDALYELGEIPLEGEDPGTRWRRINNISDDYWLDMDYDEDDDSVTAEMRASISEARKRRAEEDEKRNKITGPAFDEDLKNATEALGPDGSSRFIPGSEG